MAEKRYLQAPFWEEGSLVSSKDQFFIIIRRDRGSVWHAFGSKDGRTIVSENDEDLQQENVSPPRMP